MSFGKQTMHGGNLYYFLEICMLHKAKKNASECISFDCHLNFIPKSSSKFEIKKVVVDEFKQLGEVPSWKKIQSRMKQERKVNKHKISRSRFNDFRNTQQK